ncbi:locomotion-related protein Hikaru genki [Vespula squamosa]|uniref:Locomotion-related protein Hikaru genki n=1 Tax=Vespula squamosa TaxID=30214 RepID=A0ABD2A4G0_VESSQ
MIIYYEHLKFCAIEKIVYNIVGKVRCPYPGDPPHGRISPLKFWYTPGDNIQVTCSPGYVTPLEPVRKPTCRENGIWSAPPPPCRSYKDV